MREAHCIGRYTANDSEKYKMRQKIQHNDSPMRSKVDINEAHGAVTPLCSAKLEEQQQTKLQNLLWATSRTVSAELENISEGGDHTLSRYIHSLRCLSLYFKFLTNRTSLNTSMPLSMADWRYSNSHSFPNILFVCYRLPVVDPCQCDSTRWTTVLLSMSIGPLSALFPTWTRRARRRSVVRGR